MSILTIGILIGMAVMLLMLIGLPIFLSLGIVGLVTLFLLGPLQYDMVGVLVYESFQGFELIAIPLFILMSAFFARSNAGKDLYEVAFRWLSRIPGGLAIANVYACSVFAALSGSSPATAAAIGRIGIPEMRKRGYPGPFAAAVIIAGGTLGILIPPSITMIIYGVAVQESIGKLFLAGILPGILLALLFSGWSAIYWAIWGKKSQEAMEVGNIKIDFSLKEKLESTWKSWPSILLIALIIGSLYSGVATPSEVAAIGLVATFLIVLLWYRNLNKNTFIDILKGGAHESSMILLIIAAAILLSYSVSYLRIPQLIAENLVTLDISRWWIFIIINIFLLFLGMFLPPAAIIVMVAPILDPIIRTLDFDPIWFGVILTLNMEIGLITPPVGMNLFVVKSIVPDVSFPAIFKAVIPFILLIMFAMLILSIFPGIVLWLPSLI
jgi:C4-dicarboxylate transporter DctM subunit